MSNLNDDLQALLVLQELDTRLDRARAALAGLDSGSSIAATYNAGKATFDKLKASVVKAQANQHDAEMRLESLETKAKQVNDRLYSGKVSSPREMEDLQRELEMLGRQKSDAESAVIEAMDTAAEAMKKGQEAEAAMTSLSDRYRVVRAKYKERHGILTAEIAGMEVERSIAVQALPAALLSKYEGIRAKKGGVGAAIVLPDGNCGGCHTKLSTSQEEDVRALQAAQLCEHCGRILIPTPAGA